MEQTSRPTNQDKEPKTALDSLPVEITRKFHAPIERVWKAWSNSESIKQWWGPETYSCPEAKTDFREGGQYLFAMQGPDEKVTWSGGSYKEIVPNQKIIYTDQFTDKDGIPVSPNLYGMPGVWPETTCVTVEFESLNHDETKMNLRHEGIPKEMHDDCVQGWNSSIDKMQKLVELS